MFPIETGLSYQLLTAEHGELLFPQMSRVLDLSFLVAFITLYLIAIQILECQFLSGKTFSSLIPNEKSPGRLWA